MQYSTLKIFLILAISLSLIQVGHGGPKKRKGKAKGSGSKPETQIDLEQIDILEVPLETSLLNLRSQSHRCIYAKLPQGSDPAQNTKELIKFFRGCRDTYNDIIERKINQIGFNGQVLMQWMDLLDPLIREPEPFKIFEGDVRDDLNISKTLMKTFNSSDVLIRKIIMITYKKSKLNMIEGSSNTDIDMRTNFEEIKELDDLLDKLNEKTAFDAYYFGYGICNYLIQDPLKQILDRLFAIRNGIRQSSRDTFDHDLFLKDKNTSKHSLTGRLLFVRELCSNFSYHPSDMKLLYFNPPSEKEPGAEWKNWIETLISAFLEDGPRSVFNHSDTDEPSEGLEDDEEEAESLSGLSDYFAKMMKEEKQKAPETSNNQEGKFCDPWELKRVGQALKFLMEMQNDPDHGKLLNQLLPIANNNLGLCLESYEPDIDIALDNLKQNEEYEKSMIYMELISDYINKMRRDFKEETLNEVLSVRSQNIGTLEMKLFNNDKASDTINLKEAYRTGRDMCAIFETNEWKSTLAEYSRFQEFFDLLMDSAQYYKFLPILRHESVDLFYLWNLCGQITLLPLV